MVLGWLIILYFSLALNAFGASLFCDSMVMLSWRFNALCLAELKQPYQYSLGTFDYLSARFSSSAIKILTGLKLMGHEPLVDFKLESIVMDC